MSTDATARGEAGKWLPGVSPNPGGRPRKLRDIEAMLDAEHRTVENIREGFNILRKLAYQGVTNDVYHQGMRVGEKTEYDKGFFELYFNRVLGPIKEPPIDLSEVPDDELRVLREKLRQ